MIIHTCNPLFKRTGRNFTLTPAGNILQNYAKDILNLKKESLKAINNLKGLSSGSIRIGTTSSFSTYVIQSMIKKYKESFPGIQLSFKIDNTSITIGDLMDNKIDLALTPSIPNAKGLKTTVLNNDTLVWVASSKLKISLAEQLSPKDLIHECFIIREKGSNTRLQFDNWCSANNVHPSNLLEMNQTEMIRRAVISRLGISLISKYSFEEDLRTQGLKVLNVSGIPVERPISVTMYDKDADNILIQTFILFAKNYFNSKDNITFQI